MPGRYAPPGRSMDLQSEQDPPLITDQRNVSRPPPPIAEQHTELRPPPPPPPPPPPIQEGVGLNIAKAGDIAALRPRCQLVRLAPSRHIASETELADEVSRSSSSASASASGWDQMLRERIIAGCLVAEGRLNLFELPGPPSDDLEVPQPLLCVTLVSEAGGRGSSKDLIECPIFECRPGRRFWALGDWCLAFDSCNEGIPETIVGETYVQEGHSLGLVSYHFVGETEAYVSYNPEVCQNFPALDDGTLLPDVVQFEHVEYDAVRRIFRGLVHWSPVTWCGEDRHEYEMRFSEDFACIVSGRVNCFASDEKAPRRTLHFGKNLHYVRWHPDASVKSNGPGSSDAYALLLDGNHDAVAAALDHHGCEVIFHARTGALVAAELAQSAGSVLAGAITLASSGLGKGIRAAGDALRRSEVLGPERPVVVSQKTLRKTAKARQVTHDITTAAEITLSGITDIAAKGVAAVHQQLPSQTEQWQEDAKVVALSTASAGAEVWSALTKAATTVARDAAHASADVVGHKYGADAGETTRNGLFSVGNVLYTSSYASPAYVAQASAARSARAIAEDSGVVASSSACLVGWTPVNADHGTSSQRDNQDPSVLLESSVPSSSPNGDRGDAAASAGTGSRGIATPSIQPRPADRDLTAAPRQRSSYSQSTAARAAGGSTGGGFMDSFRGTWRALDSWGKDFERRHFDGNFLGAVEGAVDRMIDQVDRVVIGDPDLRDSEPLHVRREPN